MSNTIKAIRLILLLTLLLFGIVGYADAQTSLLVQTRIGSAKTLGFKTPSFGIGLGLERQAPRFEYDAGFYLSPDKKTFATYRKGAFSANASGSAFKNRYGVTAGVIYSVYQSDIQGVPYRKGAIIPFAGLVAKDWILPGRSRLTYLFPTGCIFPTPDNPCTIQSPRERGVQISQEFKFFEGIRIGYQTSWVHYCDQAAPTSVTRNCRYGWSAYSTLRIALK